MIRQFRQSLAAPCRPAHLAAALLWLLPFPAAAAPSAEEAWLLEDETDAVTPYDDTLVFIDAPAPDDLYRIINHVRITQESLDTGWIRIEQCHENLDPVPDLQIVYRQGQIDWIRLRSHNNIGRARVEGFSVQLQDIQRGARLCLTMRKRMTPGEPAGEYRLSHGPFYRQFLDGYYPMQVQYRLEYPPGKARIGLRNREAIRGADIRESNGAVAIDAHFAGRLKLEFQVTGTRNE